MGRFGTLAGTLSRSEEYHPLATSEEQVYLVVGELGRSSSEYLVDLFRELCLQQYGCRGYQSNPLWSNRQPALGVSDVDNGSSTA